MDNNAYTVGGLYPVISQHQPTRTSVQSICFPVIVWRIQRGALLTLIRYRGENKQPTS